MITIEHTENGKTTLHTENAFIDFVQLLYNDNENQMNLGYNTVIFPETLENALEYLIKYCPSFELIYFQPEFTDEEWGRGLFVSFEAFLNKEEAQKAFPDRKILEYKGDDIEEPTFIINGDAILFDVNGEHLIKEKAKDEFLEIQGKTIKSVVYDDIEGKVTAVVLGCTDGTDYEIVFNDEKQELHCFKLATYKFFN